MTTNQVIYLKGLNGIRAIAALAVVVAHTTLTLGSFGLDSHIFGTYQDGNPRTLDLAGYGVSIFFGLSGFLITFLLCKEKEKQSVNVRNFYMRRILRIWPLYYSYIILCLITYFIFDIDFREVSLYYYIFFSANIPFILGGVLPYIGHFWSLGVEEQFYIFWPWINKLQSKKILSVSIVAVFFLIVVKTLLHIFSPNTTLELAIHVTRFHCMLMGAATAILFYNKNDFFLKITTHPIVQMICWICFILTAVNKFHIASFLDNEILTGVTCLIIVGQVTGKGLVSLENRVFDFLGKISYGIYVIHPLLLFYLRKLYQSNPNLIPINYVIVYSIVIGSTLFLAHVSYKYLEKPFLKLKLSKFSTIKSSGSRYYKVQ